MTTTKPTTGTTTCKEWEHHFTKKSTIYPNCEHRHCIKCGCCQSINDCKYFEQRE